MNTKPFRESIIEAINDVRTGRELACLVNLVISSVIPANHDAILQAFRNKKGKLTDDYLIEMVEQSLLNQAESHLLKEKERVTAEKKCLNEEPFEYTAKHGTKFFAKRCDFQLASEVIGVSITMKPEGGVGLQDVVEMIEYHRNHILPFLRDFPGYNEMRFFIMNPETLEAFLNQ